MARDAELNTIIALASKIQRRIPKTMLHDLLRELRSKIDEYLLQNK